MGSQVRFQKALAHIKIDQPSDKKMYLAQVWFSEVLWRVMVQ